VFFNQPEDRRKNYIRNFVENYEFMWNFNPIWNFNQKP